MSLRCDRDTGTKLFYFFLKGATKVAGSLVTDEIRERIPTILPAFFFLQMFTYVHRKIN